MTVKRILVGTNKRWVVLPFTVCLLAQQRAAEAAPSCAITTLTSVAFGSYDSQAAGPLDSIGTVVVRCASGSASVIYSLTAGSSGSFSPRTMTSPSNHTLAFNLFLDSAHSVVWGDGTSGTSVYGPISVPQDTDTPAYIYGRMPAGQAVPAGTYVDTLTLLITF